MKPETSARAARFALCTALLALLAASSYARRRPMQTPVVPVMIETVSHETLAGETMEQTRARLAQQREDALALLQSVLADPDADEAQKKQALAEKTKIAARMETEASVCALLAHMGFDQTAVVAGEEALSIVAPWQIAENEHSRVRMIDAAAGQSGLDAGSIKIILAKK